MWPDAAQRQVMRSGPSASQHVQTPLTCLGPGQGGCLHACAPLAVGRCCSVLCCPRAPAAGLLCCCAPSHCRLLLLAQPQPVPWVDFAGWTQAWCWLRCWAAGWHLHPAGGWPASRSCLATHQGAPAIRTCLSTKPVTQMWCVAAQLVRQACTHEHCCRSMSAWDLPRAACPRCPRCPRGAWTELRCWLAALCSRRAAWHCPAQAPWLAAAPPLARHPSAQPALLQAGQAAGSADVAAVSVVSLWPMTRPAR